MLLYIVVLVIVLVLLTYFTVKQKNYNVIMVFLFTSIIIYFLSFPKQCINSTLLGAKIFTTAVFPSIFPFLVICNLLISYDGINIYSKLFGKLLCKPLRLSKQSSLTIIISALCGYPLGAKYACDTYEKGLISKEECERLLNIASNTSPLFIVGSVSTAMIGMPKLGYLLLISNYISCIMMSLVLKPVHFYRSAFFRNEKNSQEVVNFGGKLKNSIENALRTAISIGGYIIFFAVLLDIISYNKYFDLVLSYISHDTLLKDIVKFFMLGIIELTKGCQLISTLNISITVKAVLISFLSGFSGLSIISQVYSFTYRFPEFSIKTYIKRKAVQGVFSSLITAVLMIPFSKVATNTFSGNITGPSFSEIYIVFILLLILPICINSIKKLLHIS
ncbi:MAG TPA: sporulation integral membrane protein YlbJ [Clostridium sp.]|nr:sporulation integral membrane protein YlbJ [Clostridium sp.]